MGLIRILSTAFLIGVCTAPALATDRDYNSFVEGALEIYKQFEEPSISESQKFLSFVNKKWEANNKLCNERTCSIDGQSAGIAYAMANKVKLNNEI